MGRHPGIVRRLRFLRRFGLALLLLLPAQSLSAQAPDMPVYPGAELDRELTEAVQAAEKEVGGAATFAYATDDSMDDVIAFYEQHGFRRLDHPEWEEISEKLFGVRIRRVWMLHPSTPEDAVDIRDWRAVVGLERPYARLKSLADLPSPDNVVQRTGITISDWREAERQP